MTATTDQGASDAQEGSEVPAVDSIAAARGRGWRVAEGVALAVAVAIAFVPAVGNGFVGWDDTENFVKNLDFRGLAWSNLRWAWTTYHVGVFQPAGWMIYEAEYTGWGMNPSGYHLASIVFQVAVALALWAVTVAVLRRVALAAGGDDAGLALGSALAVALYAVHPLRVEVVAWVSCQPYLPSTMIALLSVLAYLRGCDPPRFAWKALAWALFALALLTKVAVVSLPFVLLILDVYPLRRIGPGRWTGPAARRVYFEKLPFLALALTFMLLAVLARAPHAKRTDVRYNDLVPRLARSVYGVWFYPVKTLVPYELAAYYPLPVRNEDYYTWPFGASAAATVVAASAAFCLRRRWPGLLAACGCYLVCLVPNLGLIRVGNYITADRYSYVSTMAFVPPLAYALTSLLRRPALRGPVLAVALGLVVGLSALSWRQCRTWRTTESLWAQACHGSRDNPAINLKMGIARIEEGRAAEAKERFIKVLMYDPENVTAFVNLGGIALREGNPDEAEGLWNKALDLNPASAEALSGIGLIRAQQGRLEEAEEWHRRALRANPIDAKAHNNLGVALARQGRLDEAGDEFARAVRNDAKYPEARCNLGRWLAGRGQLEEAVAQYAEAVRLRPDYASAHAAMGSALALLGRDADAAAQLEAALRADPNQADARRELDRLRPGSSPR